MEKRDTPYPAFYCPTTHERFEDRSLTGSMIHGLERALLARQRDTEQNSVHLSEGDRAKASKVHFASHIQAWDRPAMAAMRSLDGDEPPLFAAHENDDHER
jgi:hypothetical protein